MAADDVVYISAPEPRGKSVAQEKEAAKVNTFLFLKYLCTQRRYNSVLMNPGNENHVENRDTTLKDLDQIRNLYRSVPNVSTLEDNE